MRQRLLEPPREDDLLDLALERPLGREQEGLHDLLRDRRRAFLLAAGAEVREERAHHARVVDAAVGPELGVLGRDERVDHDRRDLVVGDERAALGAELADPLVVRVEDRRDLLGVVVAELRGSRAGSDRVRTSRTRTRPSRRPARGPLIARIAAHLRKRDPAPARLAGRLAASRPCRAARLADGFALGGARCRRPRPHPLRRAWRHITSILQAWDRAGPVRRLDSPLVASSLPHTSVSVETRGGLRKCAISAELVWSVSKRSSTPIAPRILRREPPRPQHPSPRVVEISEGADRLAPARRDPAHREPNRDPEVEALGEPEHRHADRPVARRDRGVGQPGVLVAERDRDR